MNTLLQVTPLDDLMSMAQGEVVALPPFVEDKPFVVRLKKPSMMVLMKSGKIPNALLGAAAKIFSGDIKAEDLSQENFFQDINSVLEVVAEAALLEPTWEQLQDIGLELTDEQRMAIFNYTQKGIKALEPFCQQPTHLRDNQDGQGVAL